MLTKQLGARFDHDGSTAAGTKVIGSAMASYGIHPKILDGSGLSRQDSSSPREVADLLKAVWGTPSGHVLDAALPLVGVNGTTRHIGVGTPAQGRCVAKTGTLDNVTNLAGYCRALNHHELAFALFLDGPDNRRGIALLSKLVAAMVRY
jgi:D-alanyl-D-alanine carboxypeptidase/D-alanyl-D-alanine-endopeptidase (penicillin-binding protein 4)